MNDDEEKPIIDTREAAEELVWRFHAADAAIGIRAQNMGDVKGSSVFDDQASHETHLRMREAKYRWAVNRMRAVDITLGIVSANARHALTLAFTPGGRAESKIATHFEIAFGAQRASILGFALRSNAMRTAWREHHTAIAMPDQDQFLRLLEKAPADTLKAISRNALRELQPHLEEYAEARVLRIQYEREQRDAKRRAREALGDLAIQASRERIWGKP